MKIDALKDGIVIDHIKPGKGMSLYKFLNLDKLDCSVALITNATSPKLEKKDIIKIGTVPDLDLDVLGYIDPGVTVNIIKDGKVVKKYRPQLPETLTDVLHCSNPRCITSIEQEIPHIFKLTDREKGEYRCIYCESKPKK